MFSYTEIIYIVVYVVIDEVALVSIYTCLIPVHSLEVCYHANLRITNTGWFHVSVIMSDEISLLIQNTGACTSAQMKRKILSFFFFLDI
jgi:hypothetical protein